MLTATLITSLTLLLSDLAHASEQILRDSLGNPGPLTIALVFTGGFLTSMGPCSLSLLPVTVAYLAGFKDNSSSLQRSLNFSAGIVLSLVLLGSLSGLVGKIYGQIPAAISTFVAILAICMGLNLLGFLKIPFPNGPDPDKWRKQVPVRLGPVTTGFAFGLAASPCTTPVLAVLLGWIAKTGSPLIGILLLASFGTGQVLPLVIAGTAAGNISKLLALRPLGRIIPPISGTILLSTGLLSLLSKLV